MNKRNHVIVGVLLAAFLLTSCSGALNDNEEKLTASGTISAKSVKIAPQIGGSVKEIFVDEGSFVNEGDILFSLESEYLESQLEQADAGVETAAAALETARVQQENANLQLLMAIQNSRMQYSEALENEQSMPQPSEFELPVWYFSREEEIEAAKGLVEKAKIELDSKKETLDDVLSDIVNNEFVKLEEELNEAQTIYILSASVLENVGRASDNEELRDQAQDNFDLSESNLENVQKRYEKALETDAAEDVLAARAAVSVSQASYDEALNHLMSLYIGDDSLQVQSAETGVSLAKMNIAQAEAALKQAQTNVTTLEIQLSKTKITSPISGVVLAKNVEEGELVGAGGVVMSVGNYDTANLTVYIPEDEYGHVQVGQKVEVTVDSFINRVYTGTVSYIADEAEFTPSNVQTVEGRKSTVFAVKITIKNESHDLKPGMPADVTFIFD